MANITVTHTFTNATTADATEVNTNFTDLINGTSDGTKDFSISALTCAGAATFNGNVNIGNASSDELTITSVLAATLAVKAATAIDIGSSTNGLQYVYLEGNDKTIGLGKNAAATASEILLFPAAAGSAGKKLVHIGSNNTIWAHGEYDINAVSEDNYTVTDTDCFRTIVVTTGSSDRTVTLPTASDNTDRILTIKKADNGDAAVIVDGEGSETIDGNLTLELRSQYDTVTLQCNGTTWHILELYKETAYVGTNPEVGGSSPFSISYSHKKIQVINPAADVTVKLPATGVVTGEVWEVVNRSSYVVTVQSEDATEYDIIGTGHLKVISLDATPSAATDWHTVDVLEHATFITGTTGAVVGDVKAIFTRHNNRVTLDCAQVGSASVGGTTIAFDSVPSRFLIQDDSLSGYRSPLGYIRGGAGAGANRVIVTTGAISAQNISGSFTTGATVGFGDYNNGIWCAVGYTI